MLQLHLVITKRITDLFSRLSLYRGLFPVLVTLCCSNFVYFYTYNGLKTTYLSDIDKETPIKDLTFAFVAGKTIKNATKFISLI